MKRLSLSVGVIVLIAAIGGFWYFRSNDLVKALNAGFHPVTADEQRQKAIETSAAVLTQMPLANVAAGVDLHDVEGFLKTHPVLVNLGMTKLVLHADQQLLNLDVAFDHVFIPEDIPMPPDPRIGSDGKPVANVEAAKVASYQAEVEKVQHWRDDLTTWRPNIAGGLTLGFSITGASRTSDRQTVTMNLLPAFKNIKIDRVVITDKSIEVTRAAQTIGEVMNRYADNISSILTGIDIMRVALPPALFEKFNPSRTLTSKDGAKDRVKVTLVSAPVSPPTAVTAVGWLLDKDKAVALIRFDTDPPNNPGTGSEELVPQKSATMADLNSQAAKHLTGIFNGNSTPEGTWVAVSKTLLSSSVNTLFAEAQPCLSLDVDLPTKRFDNEITFPDLSGMECTPNRQCNFDQIQCEQTKDCSGGQISCPLNQDTTDCQVCSRYKILQFHGLQTSYDWTETCVNNPVCEASKATQNGLYASQKATCEAGKSTWKGSCEVEKSASKLQCETNKSAQKFDCERIKGQEKLLCEGEKSSLEALRRTGKFGRVSGNFAANAALGACVPKALFAPKLEGAEIDLVVEGKAHFDTHIKFTPLDIVGHMVCQAPFTESNSLDVSIPKQAIKVKATVAYAPLEGGVPNYRISLDSFDVKAALDPNPTELLIKNTNLQLACSILSLAIIPKIVVLTPFIPELQGKIDQRISGRSFDYSPTLPDLKVAGILVPVVYSEVGNAILLKKKPKA